MRRSIVFHNGPVFVAGSRRDGLAVGVRDGQIAAVGNERDVQAAVDSKAESFDLAGRMLFPGFQDAHVHPGASGLDRLRCSLDHCENAAEVASAIAAYAASRDDEWIRGAGWTYSFYASGCPTVEALDAVVGDRPAFLEVRDGHSGWASSRALRLAGIDADTPDPDGGRIERRPDGTPQGTLHESAMQLVRAVMPADTRQDLEAGILEGQRYLFSMGVTAWQDAIVDAAMHDAYRTLAERGRLAGQVRGALWWEAGRGLDQLEDLEARRADAVGNYRPAAVKLMLDGIIENFTASLLEPYLDASGAETANSGLEFIDREDVRTYVAALDAAGFQCHFHAIGDRAVRSALEATETARAANGEHDLRHTVAHIQLVHPSDVRRFATSGLVANAQPLWACIEETMTALTMPFLGEERSRWQYPFGSLHRSGARLAMGSDWGVSTANVMQQVHVATHRSIPGGEALVPSEAIDLDTAFSAFTSGSAYVNHLDDARGRIAPGMVADLVVASGDPYEDGETWDLEVDLTLVGGESVFEA